MTPPFAAIATVTGSARCGTTLCMRMLHAGGIRGYADNFVSFESSAIMGLPKRTAWLDDCHGKALKLLEPLDHMPLPAGQPWRFILLRRNPIEQARSSVKLIEMLELGRTPSVHALVRALQRELPETRSRLAGYGPVLELTFEGLLAQPQIAARRMARFLDADLDQAAMAAQVVPRSPSSYPGLLETTLDPLP